MSKFENNDKNKDKLIKIIKIQTDEQLYIIYY